MSESPQEFVVPKQLRPERGAAVSAVFAEVLSTGARCSYQSGQLIYPQHALLPDWYIDVVALLLTEGDVKAEIVQVSGSTMIKVTDWHWRGGKTDEKAV